MSQRLRSAAAAASEIPHNQRAISMEWPDAAHDSFVGLPVEHRVAALYVILAVGAVGVLMALRRWLSSVAAPAAAAPPGPPVNVQLIPFDQALAAVRAELRAQLNGSLVRIEDKLDALEARVDARHAENQREFGLLHGRLDAQWDGRERRQ